MLKKQDTISLCHFFYVYLQYQNKTLKITKLKKERENAYIFIIIGRN